MIDGESEIKTLNIIPQWTICDDFVNNLGEKFYRQWERVFGRGTLQNSQDARAKRIDYIYNSEENSLTVNDDGKGMTRNVLLYKFFGIGGTTKNISSGRTIGGFGIESLGIVSGATYFHIKTKEWMAVFHDGKFQPLMKIPKMKGTEIKIIRKNKIDEEKILRILASNSIKAVITYNGDIIKNLPRYGKKVQTDFGIVHYHKMGLTNLIGKREISYKGEVIVRVKGLTMFSLNKWFKGTVIVELNNNEGLVSNREAMIETYQQKLDSFLDKLCIDKHRTFNTEKEKYFDFDTDQFEEIIPVKQERGYQITIDMANQRSIQLLTLWQKFCNFILEIEGINEKYKYGFSFASEGASINRSDKIIYLNPKGLHLTDKSLIFKLIMRGSHEIAHIKEDYHDEDFMTHYEAILETALEHLKDFREIFKTVRSTKISTVETSLERLI